MDNTSKRKVQIDYAKLNLELMKKGHDGMWLSKKIGFTTNWASNN